MSIIKEKIADSIVEQYGDCCITKNKAKDIFDHIIDTLVAEIPKNDKIIISKFGSFRTKTRKARTGRNPQTGEKIAIPERNIVTFKPAEFLKDKVNN